MTDAVKPVKRITPDEAIKAYAETGLIPKQGKYFDDNDTCACGMGVMAKRMECSSKYESDVYLQLVNVYGEEYHSGFTLGFDGVEDVEDAPSEERLIGIMDGQAVWEAVKHLSKEETTQ